MPADLTTYAATINQAWNAHEIESVLSFYAPDYVGSDVGQAALQHGQADVRLMVLKYWRAFPDLKFTILDQIMQASRMTIVWAAEGTHQGPIMNIPPTGRWVRVRGISVLDVHNGLIVRGQYVWDLAGMLRHLGLLPDLSSTAV